MATLTEALSLAWQHYQAGNLAQAEQLCGQILQVNPDHADTHHLRGILAYQTGRYDLAVSSFLRVNALSTGAAGCYSNLGLAHEALGQIDAAVACYRQALHLQPDLAIAHTNLGNALRRLRHEDQAEAHYRQALVLQPNYAEAHCNLAVVLANQGKVDEAAEHFRLAVQLNPNHAEAHYNLGSALLKQGKMEEAVFHCQQALRARPGFAQAYNNLGTARLSQGRVEEAVIHYQEALRLVPDFAEAHYNLGNALHRRGQAEEAVWHWRNALRLRPHYPEAHYNLGNALVVKGQDEVAIAHYQEALRQRPDYAEVHCNLGNAMESQDRLEEAMVHWQDALTNHPGLAEAHNNLGNAHLRMGRREEALRHSLEALRLNADFPAAWTTLGNIRQHLCQFDEALACYQTALRLDPRHGETHLNRALLWLLQGHWEAGWQEFEWRWETKGFTRYVFSQTCWDGTPLAGRTLLVPAEQGLGDTFQFIRYVQLLRQRGDRVIAVCQPALLPLLAESLGPRDVVPAGAPLPAFDVYAPLFSLPGIMGTTETHAPADIPYLRPAAPLVEKWRRELAECEERGARDEGRGARDEGRGAKREDQSLSSNLAPRPSPLAPLFKVGIAWQGSTTYGYDRQRSIPLRHFARLAQLDGIQLISLQKGPGTEQLSGVCGQVSDNQQLTTDNFQLLDLGHRLDEESGAFMDTAAVMGNLDLVISSDSAIVHLAGALGIPLWVALSLVPDWRWLLQKEDNSWYPTLRLFRQTRYGHWPDVFARIAEELKRAVTRQRDERGQ